jgi:hypothetical protein
MFKMLLITLWLALHPVHVSLMSVEYSAEVKGFRVFMKVYYDDFLTDFRTLKGNPPAPDLSKADESARDKIGEYLKQKVHLSVGEKDLPLELVDFSLADNELKLNLICRMNKNAKVVTVRNKILTDIYRDQTNFVILNYGSFEEGVKLTPEKSEYSFVVKK